MTAAPSMYSKHIPGLQLAWDATSLRQLMKCEQMYDYGIRQGWRGTGTHMEFGRLFASALEVGWKARAHGASWEATQFESVKWAVEHSGHYDERDDGTRPWLPWGGAYHDQWKCSGEQPYTNEKGNRAKCPNAFVKVWHDGDPPELCGTCGSRTVQARRWLPYDPSKNRLTLIRLVAWYWEEQGDTGLQIVSLPNGQPAVELSFCIPSGYKASTGEDFLLCGHIDSIKEFAGEHFICDNKTTAKYLGDDYFAGYSPDVQVDLYDLAGSIMFPDLNLRGVLIEAAQVQVNSADFGMRPIYRSEEMREEFHTQLGHWFEQAEILATRGPILNRGTCWLCGFKRICAKAPAERQKWLEVNFEKAPWNPLEVR